MNELMHYGIPRRSGRYKWGSGERPFQSSGGLMKNKKSERRLRKEQRKSAKEYKQKLEEAEAKRKLDADKDRVLREGSATEVLRYQGKITNQQLNEALTRIRLENELKKYSKSDIETALNKMDKVMEGVKKINNWANTGTDSWNIIASLYNATKEGKKNPLPMVKKSGGDQKKDKK